MPVREVLGRNSVLKWRRVSACPPGSSACRDASTVFRESIESIHRLDPIDRAMDRSVEGRAFFDGTLPVEKKNAMEGSKIVGGDSTFLL